MKNETTNAILDLLELFILGVVYLVALTILFGMFLGDIFPGIVAAICFTFVFAIIVHFLRKNN